MRVSGFTAPESPAQGLRCPVAPSRTQGNLGRPARSATVVEGLGASGFRQSSHPPVHPPSGILMCACLLKRRLPGGQEYGSSLIQKCS